MGYFVNVRQNGDPGGKPEKQLAKEVPESSGDVGNPVSKGTNYLANEGGPARRHRHHLYKEVPFALEIRVIVDLTSNYLPVLLSLGAAPSKLTANPTIKRPKAMLYLIFTNDMQAVTGVTLSLNANDAMLQCSNIFPSLR